MTVPERNTVRNYCRTKNTWLHLMKILTYKVQNTGSARFAEVFTKVLSQTFDYYIYYKCKMKVFKSLKY